MLLGLAVFLGFILANPALAIDQVSCVCTFKFNFLTEKGESCANDNACLASGSDLTFSTITATNETNGSQSFEFGPYKQGDTFGVSVAAKIMGKLSNISFYDDGSVDIQQGAGGVSGYTFKKAALDKKFPGIKVVQISGASDWSLNLNESPTCIPASQQSGAYAFSVNNGRYLPFSISCSDKTNQDTAGQTGTGSAIPKNKSENDATMQLAKTELNRIGTTDIRVFLGEAVKILMGVMGSIALAMFVYAGFLWMVSGTMDSVEKARSILVWSSMGMVIIFASYALVQLIFATF